MGPTTTWSQPPTPRLASRLQGAYYGIALALGTLVHGHLAANFALTAAAELPAYLCIAAFVDRWG